MLEYMIDSIFIKCDGRVFHQTTYIPGVIFYEQLGGSDNVYRTGVTCPYFLCLV